jgi:serine/threonine protein kinase
MTPERWREVEELYHAALDRGPAALANAPPELRKEVEALLAPNGTLPPLEELTRSIVTPGTLLGPYRIDSLLGAGGMGEVFRAVDTRLGRGVAIKTCPAQFIPRFEREARAISSLNHPHICTLYDVGPNYLVMELVEGETLAARLKNGPLPMELVFEYGTQIAEALMEAHAKGITHRDLKPGNIMIAKMGVSKTGIKVLDFGLAKTGDETLTQTNAIMGTPAYMAPEQLRGQPADTRSDIYSFGLVLYEMATGKRLPPGQPKLPASIPEKLARVIERCLKETPEERCQKISELVTGLEPGAAAAPAATPKRGKWITAGAVLAAALIVSGYFYFERPRKLTDKDTIVLADFTNKTDDPVFDDALRQGLAAELEQSPFLSLVPDERIQATLRLMTQPPDAKLTPEIAKGVCERIGSAAVLEGSITPLGSRYVLGLRAKRCHNGEVLDEEQAQAGTKKKY